MTQPTPQALLEAACSLRDATRLLLDRLGAEAPPRFHTACEQMAVRAQQLCDQVNELSRLNLHDRQVRHGLRSHLALVIAQCGLWLRLAEQFGAQAFRHNLEQVAELARTTLDRLDAAVSALTDAGATAESAVSASNQAGTSAPSHTAPAPLPPLAERGNLLVVDDSAENRDLLHLLLQQQGHQVTVAASGPEALDLLGHQPFDLILLDVMMPDMDGFAVLERLKSNDDWRHIPVVMVSALDRLDAVINCIARGAEDYLIKPFNELLLRARVGACLEKKRLRDREMEHLQRIDSLLRAIFPEEVLPELTREGTIRPRRYERVGVCFADVVGFTSFCDQHLDRPEYVAGMLKWYVGEFERVAREQGVQKIKTIGDAFMMASGLPVAVDNPVLRLVRCAHEMLAAIRKGPAGWQVRVGIHVGPVVAGTLGEQQYSFDLWGATVNIAARMESIGRPDTITLSDTAWQDVAEVCRGEPRDAAVRGIGHMIVWEVNGFRAE
jgi:CheY-like chemotaxis protein